MIVPVSEARNRLSQWLERIREGPITITRRGKPVAVLASPEEYDRLRQAQAYLEMLRISTSLQDTEVTAGELLRASREGLEQRE